MNNLREYSGITTKVRAMQAKLLKDEDFEEIVSLKSVPEAVEYLKEKPAYAEYINKMDASLYHRGTVEKILVQSLYDDYARLYRFSGIEQKKFLRAHWKRYEVDMINYCLRIVFNHYAVPTDIEYIKRIFDKYSQLSISRLAASRNIEELVDNLKGSEYYAPLIRLRDVGGATLFDYDLTLELYYYAMMWRSEKRLLKGVEKDMFIKDYGMKIDLVNLQWIYRAKKYYKMQPSDIYSITIPINYRFSTEEFKGLVEAPTVEDFLNRVGQTRYASKMQFGEGAKSLEYQYKELMKAAYLSDRRRNPYSIAIINTYMFLKGEEISKLITALECIRYGLSSRETLEYLGGVMQ